MRSIWVVCYRQKDTPRAQWLMIMPREYFYTKELAEIRIVRRCRGEGLEYKPVEFREVE